MKEITSLKLIRISQGILVALMVAVSFYEEWIWEYQNKELIIMCVLLIVVLILSVVEKREKRKLNQ